MFGLNTCLDVKSSGPYLFRFEFNIGNKASELVRSTVVYFDQRTHACACVCMVENDKNIQKWWKKYLSSCAREAQVRPMKKNEEKVFVLFFYVCLLCPTSPPRSHTDLVPCVSVYTLKWRKSLLVSNWEWLPIIIFQCFSSFSTKRTHGQACVCWSKYTTVNISGNSTSVFAMNPKFWLMTNLIFNHTSEVVEASIWSLAPSWVTLTFASLFWMLFWPYSLKKAWSKLGYSRAPVGRA